MRECFPKISVIITLVHVSCKMHIRNSCSCLRAHPSSHVSLHCFSLSHCPHPPLPSVFSATNGISAERFCLRRRALWSLWRSKQCRTWCRVFPSPTPATPLPPYLINTCRRHEAASDELAGRWASRRWQVCWACPCYRSLTSLTTAVCVSTSTVRLLWNVRVGVGGLHLPNISQSN